MAENTGKTIALIKAIAGSGGGGGGGGAVDDVQVNGTSVVSNGVANIPLMTNDTFGVAFAGGNYGVITNSSGRLVLNKPTPSLTKAGTNDFIALMPFIQHESTFYGLAKAAGDSTQSASSNAVGSYTESAKSAITQMISGAVSVSGTTPTITGMAGVRYVCGEVSTISITAPESGCIDVVFESGSTPAVLTVTSAKTGVTAIKWANGFDPTSLDADTTYEVNILDGEFGVVGSWT